MPDFPSVSRNARPPQPHAHDRGQVHVCQRGDTLWDIARAHGVSLQELQAANPQIEGGRIFSGTHVRIPARRNAGGSAEASGEAPGPARRAPPAEVQQDRRRGAVAADDAGRRRVQGLEMPAAAAATNAATNAGRTGRLDEAAVSRRADGSFDVTATRQMTEAQKFDFYKQLIADSGGKFHTAPNARNIVGLRQETNPRSNGGRGVEDDRFVMLWQDKNGRKHVKEFTGTTEGSEANRRSFSSDVDGDGRRDLGRIPLGHYEYQVGSSARLGQVLRPTSAFRVERDFNNDGRYEGRREQNADVSSAFLFHKGSSAGCQTMGEREWDRFWGALHSSGRPAKIGYTLVAV
jgi:LysM repeat protein